jgi:hypothetical protein
MSAMVRLHHGLQIRPGSWAIRQAPARSRSDGRRTDRVSRKEEMVHQERKQKRKRRSFARTAVKNHQTIEEAQKEHILK